MIKYRKFFGIIRIFLGILFFMYPAYEFFSQGDLQSEESFRWLFVMLFFLAYAYSSVKNGIREIGGLNPAFNLLRFFEASMNGFLSLYLLILVFASEMSGFANFFIIILALITIFNMVRDIRIISLQYYEKKQKTRK